MSRQTKQADPLEPERHHCARVGVSSNHSRDRGSTMNVTTYGLDLAKRVFQVHWVEPDTGELKRKALARAEVAAFFARRAPGVVAMGAGGPDRLSRARAGACGTVEPARGAGKADGAHRGA